MAGLEISMNADQLIRVAEQSKQALAGMAKAADQTAASVGKVGQTFDQAAKTIGPSGGGGGGASGGGGSSGTGLAARISGVTGAMSGLRSVVGATSFSQLSFEVGKLYDDFQGLKAGLGSTATGFGALKAVMKAHPILTIASIVSAATMAFSYLSSAIGDTKDKYSDLAQTIRRAKLDEQAAMAFGLSTSSAKEAQMQGVVSGYTSLLGTGDFNVASLSAATGKSPQDVAQFMWNQTRDPRYLDFLMGQEFGTGRFTESNVRGRTEVLTRNPAELKMTQQQAAAFSRQTYEGIGATIDYGYGAGAGKTAPSSMMYGPTRDEAGVQAERIADEQRQAAMEAQRQMDQLIAKGEQFGEVIGDGFYNAVSGAQSLRQVVAGIISDFARMASRQAFSGLGGALFGGFGGTANQGQFQGPVGPDGAIPGPVN